MLNYEPKIINTKDPKIQKAYRDKEFKGHGVIKLLNEIWSLKRNITALKIIEIYAEFEEFFKGLKEEDRKTIVLRIFEYLKDNTDLSSKTWEQVEEQLIEKGLLTKGGLMQDVREVIKEKGIWEGMQKGREEGLQEGLQKAQQEIILKMLKEKVDIAFISKITGFSEAEIKKLRKNS